MDLLRRVLQQLDVDRAVAYALSLRVWQLVGGTVSVLLISAYFSREQQGYYYTLSSLMLLQSFFDLGLSGIIVNIASHEWAKLRLDESGQIDGDSSARSRLISLGRLLARWYGIACVLFVIGVGIGGAVFLSLQPDVGIAWQRPWWALVVLTGLLLWTMPFAAMLEACGQVTEVNRFRLVQAIATNVVIWIALLAGAELWVVVAGIATRVVVALLFLRRRVDTFFRPFFAQPIGPRIVWRDEVWPLQWRIGLSSVAGYFASSLFTPVLFHFHGPTLAGQMGMTWTLLSVAHAGSLAWMQTRVPRFGSLAAARQWSDLDRLFQRVTVITVTVMMLGGLALFGLVCGMHAVDFRLADRLLPPFPILILVLALTAHVTMHGLSVYVHAHKQDPLAAVQICGNTAIGLAVWWFGSRYGATGAAAGYLAVATILMLPATSVIWNRCRREWHG